MAKTKAIKKQPSFKLTDADISDSKKRPAKARGSKLVFTSEETKEDK